MIKYTCNLNFNFDFIVKKEIDIVCCGSHVGVGDYIANIKILMCRILVYKK